MVAVTRPLSRKKGRWQEETIIYTKHNQLEPN